MLKFYIISSIIITILALVAEVKSRINKNIKTFMKKNYSKKRKWYQVLWSWIKTILYGWIPLINIFIGFMYLYILFASDYSVIKILKKGKDKLDSEEKKMKRLLEEEN